MSVAELTYTLHILHRQVLVKSGMFPEAASVSLIRLKDYNYSVGAIR